MQLKNAFHIRSGFLFGMTERFVNCGECHDATRECGAAAARMPIFVKFWPGGLIYMIAGRARIIHVKGKTGGI